MSRLTKDDLDRWERWKVENYETDSYWRNFVEWGWRTPKFLKMSALAFLLGMCAFGLLTCLGCWR